MKQRTMKTLGVAVLGAAFAAAGAGAAAAAPLGLEQAAGSALKTLPVQEAAKTLPAPAGVPAKTLPAEAGTKAKPAKSAAKPAKKKDPVRGLLGGLPAGGAGETLLNLPTGKVTGGLPTGGLPN